MLGYCVCRVADAAFALIATMVLSGWARTLL